MKIIRKLIITVLFFFSYSCMLQPGGGNGGGGSTSSSSGPAQLSVIYVATNGSDLNSGSNKTEPFLSIQKAVDMAADNAVINVARGVYTNGNGLNVNEILTGVIILNKHNLQFLGGWNTNYTSRTGTSELDGNKQLCHIIFISNTAGILFDGFVVRNGNATNASGWDNLGGGMIIISSSYCNVSNSVISNNSAGSGGGIYLSICSNNTIDGIICNNLATGDGGGVFIAYKSAFNSISGIVCFNTSQGFAGGVCIVQSSNNTVSGNVLSNSAGPLDGGGIYIKDGSYNTISGNISGNTTGGCGGGIEIAGRCIYNTISGNITGNTAFGGGGISMYENFVGNYNAYNTVSGNITSNSAYYGGGMYLSWVFFNVISGNITGNTATNGGGICIESGSNNIIRGSISSNSAQYGGAIYISDYSRNNLVTNALLLCNKADNGVICFCSNNTSFSIIDQFIGNTIGGQGSGYGFYEYNADIFSNTIVSNIFLTNTLGFLYHDYVNGETGLDEIDVLNTPSDPRHDAITAYGNSVSNEY